jgi:hypothetical protein
MKKMLTVLILALSALAGLSMADNPEAKTYKINLVKTSKIGDHQLAAGDYMLAVDTASVRVVEVRTGSAFEIAAKVESGEKKHERTAITTNLVDGVAEIRQIDLGGTKVRIDFR